MSSKSFKIERILEDEALQAVLDALDTALRPEIEGALAADGFRKLKIVIKRDFGQARARLKITLPKPGGENDEDDQNDCIAPGAELEKYSRLKKRMKDSFGTLKANLAEDRLPPEEAVASFLADSDVMVCYPGYGDEFYLDYTKACKALDKAWEKQDLEALKAAVSDLEARKTECHDKYK